MAQKDAIIIPITLMAAGNGSGQGGGGGGTSPEEELLPQNDTDKNQKQAMFNAQQSRNFAKAVAVKAAGNAASLALEGYGDITGDYVTGHNLQVTISEVTSTVSGAIGSFAHGGWWGLAAYATDKTIDWATQGYKYISSLKKSEAQSRFNQKRVYGTTRHG